MGAQRWSNMHKNSANVFIPQRVKYHYLEGFCWLQGKVAYIDECKRVKGQRHTKQMTGTDFISWSVLETDCSVT